MAVNCIEKRSTLIHLPTTETVHTSLNVDSAAKDVWSMVGDFGGFHRFIDGLTSTEMTGEGVRSVRKKMFADGNVVIEQLNSINDDEMMMTWTLIYTSLDINNLWSAMYVEEIDDHKCCVSWDIAGEPFSKETTQADFNKFLTGFAEAALVNVKNKFETNSSAE